jgi:hypothetical protein
MAAGICRADCATPLYPQKLALTSPTSGDHCQYSLLSDWGHGVVVVVIIIIIIIIITASTDVWRIFSLPCVCLPHGYSSLPCFIPYWCYLLCLRILRGWQNVNVGLQTDVYPLGFCTKMFHVPYSLCSMLCVGPVDWYTKLRNIMKEVHLTLWLWLGVVEV